MEGQEGGRVFVPFPSRILSTSCPLHRTHGVGGALIYILADTFSRRRESWRTHPKLFSSNFIFHRPFLSRSEWRTLLNTLLSPERMRFTASGSFQRPRLGGKKTEREIDTKVRLWLRCQKRTAFLPLPSHLPSSSNK